MIVRTYGVKPYKVALLHGGPGAGGEMEPLAKELSDNIGVIEPIQTALSVEGQVEKLKSVIIQQVSSPLIIVGWSWGAWLGYLLGAKHPRLVKKLIIIGSGPFNQAYVNSLTKTRMSRLNEEEVSEFNNIIKDFNNSEIKNKDEQLSRLGELTSKTDNFELIKDQPKLKHRFKLRGDIYERVWPEAAELRRSGELLSLGRLIRCPVVAIHGDYDPHPAEGVKNPLLKTLDNFKFILLEKCGHTPWKEVHAQDSFYYHLKREIQEET